MRFETRLRQERMRRQLSQETLAEALGVSRRSILRWEQGQAVPQASVRLELSRFFDLPPKDLFDDPETQTPSAALWGVPYQRNPFFTGREEILHTLHEQFNREHATSLAQAWAIGGLGGVGKTQIALEYAYHFCQDYRFVFWTNAATREMLLTDVMNIANLLQLPERDEQDQEKVLAAVKQWFATHQEWLWILDNADDVEIVHDILPSQRPGHLLLTTRAQALGALAQRIEVQTMSMAEGTLFLLRRARLLAPEASLAQIPDTLLAAAEAIVTEMDFLPLALDQAGAYIEEVRCNLPMYLELYRRHRKELLQRRGLVPTDHPEPVATTWSLSFRKVEQANPAAAELLRLCTFLEPDAIPEELISAGSQHLGSTLGPVAADAFLLNEAIKELLCVSLLQRNAETRTLRIHRLVQAVIQDQMESGEMRLWRDRVVRVVNAAFPEPELAAWGQCERCLAHALVSMDLIAGADSDPPEASELFYKAGSYLLERARYKQAGLLLEQSVILGERQYGSDHPMLIPALMKQAKLFWSLREYEASERQLRRMLSIGEHHLEMADPRVVEALSDLGTLFWHQGKYEQAERLLRQALELEEQHLRPDHPQIAETLNNLGCFYNLQGKPELAEPLLQRALSIREQRYGSEHPETSLTLSNLAMAYQGQGKYKQAEPLYRRALHIQERLQGPQHPNVALILNRLAVMYKQQRKYEQAESLYQRSLHIWEQQLGSKYLDMAASLSGLANVYCEQTQYIKAESLFQRCLHILEQQLQPEHPRIAITLHDLARLYRLQGQVEKAEPLYERALHIREQALGPYHYKTAATFHDFALLRQAQGRHSEARSLYEHALTARTQILGSEHPHTLETRECLAILLRNMKDDREKTTPPS